MLESVKEHFRERVLEINPCDWSCIFIVGDIHGCIDEFVELIRRIQLSDTDLLVCVGDVIGKGPDSSAVVDLIMSYPNVLSVLGNYEWDLLNKQRNETGISSSYRDYIETWPLVIGWENDMVIHGGLNSKKPIHEHDENDLVSIRSPENDNRYESPFWFERYEGKQRIYFGHTVLEDPIRMNNTVGLDTGCVYGGALTAYDRSGDRFLSVPARNNYKKRDSSRWADRIMNDKG